VVLKLVLIQDPDFTIGHQVVTWIMAYHAACPCWYLPNLAGSDECAPKYIDLDLDQKPVMWTTKEKPFFIPYFAVVTLYDNIPYPGQMVDLCLTQSQRMM